MIRVNFSELVSVLDFASYGGPYEHQAFVDRDTGAVHFDSDGVDLDDEMADQLEEDSDRFLPVPHKNDLDLGRNLAISFVEQHLPKDYDQVMGYFHKRGAYSRFKDLLVRRGVLDAWYEFEREATRRAITRWCEVHDIQLDFSQPVI